MNSPQRESINRGTPSKYRKSNLFLIDKNKEANGNCWVWWGEVIPLLFYASAGREQGLAGLARESHPAPMKKRAGEGNGHVSTETHTHTTHTHARGAVPHMCKMSNFLCRERADLDQTRCVCPIFDLSRNRTHGYFFRPSRGTQLTVRLTPSSSATAINGWWKCCCRTSIVMPEEDSLSSSVVATIAVASRAMFFR